MTEYRILWERTQLGNTIVKANSEKEAKKIADKTTRSSKIKWTSPKISIVGAYTFKQISETIK